MKSNYFFRTGFLALTIFTIVSCKEKVEKINYSTGTWDADSLGYHRVVLRVEKKAEDVVAHIEWRRRDKNPEQKGFILIDGMTGQRIPDVISLNITREAGDIVFKPVTVPGDYFLYYLPGKSQGRRNYPNAVYPLPSETADSLWASKYKGLTFSEISQKTQSAKVISIEARDEFNSFYPMEVIATKNETEQLITEYPEKDFLVFSEDRSLSIRMKDDLPLKWINDRPSRQVQGNVMKGEYFTFQLGVFAAKNAIKNVIVKFSDLKGSDNNIVIPSSEFTCFNTGGRNWDNTLFTKQVDVEKGTVQALWCGVMIPEEVKNSSLSGNVTVTCEGFKPETIDIKIEISKKTIANHGDNEPANMTRLRWLNSDKAFNDEIVKPFTQINREGNKLNILGREIALSESGLPSGYTSYFSPDVTSINEKGKPVLSGPMDFVVQPGKGSIINWKNQSLNFEKEAPAELTWKSVSTAGNMEMIVDGSLEADGFAKLRILLVAKSDINLNNVHFYIPVNKEFSEYFMGLGLRGGLRPSHHEWKWDRMLHQEGAWIGGVNGGVQYALRDDKYVRPLNTNFYRDKPLIMPDAWFNDGKGGIKITTVNGKALIDNYSGSRTLKSGDTLHFNVNLLFTPFKTIITDNQWNTRFYHKYSPVDSIKKYGANTINIHHANAINPWLNYPFLEPAKMKAYIDSAHSAGMKVKIYNTIRELSDRAPELFAIRSLGHEVFSGGKGGGFNWLQEHLAEDYIPAWFVPDLKDAAIINSGMSRWHNYYIEGMNWLTKEVGIDGLYLDDVAFDRTTMKRLRKVLDANRDGALIDLHSANQFNVRDGFTNSAYLYMEHFPYLNRLWFGEYFDRNLPPDFWLVEMSGIPFGLMGEMLQDGGNQYRGMIYGMTSRAPWSGDPGAIWKVWDDFGMTGTKMTGYWSENCPVKTGYSSIPATVYSKSGMAMIAIASWDKLPRNVKLTVDWKKLGIEKTACTILIPSIKGFQEEQSLKADELITVNPAEGKIIIIKTNNKN
jgi:hypothetical protein